MFSENWKKKWTHKLFKFSYLINICFASTSKSVSGINILLNLPRTRLNENQGRVKPCRLGSTTSPKFDPTHNWTGSTKSHFSLYLVHDKNKRFLFKILISYIIYILKQDIMHIYVAYSRPNSWTEWADIFCGHSWVAGGVFG